MTMHGAWLGIGSEAGVGRVGAWGVACVMVAMFGVVLWALVWTASTWHEEYVAVERKREEWEVDNAPELERAEMIELYTRKGLPEDDAERVIDIISQHPKFFVDVMMVEELGILPEKRSPFVKASLIASAFLGAGLGPSLLFLATGLASPSSHLASLLPSLSLAPLAQMAFEHGFALLSLPVSDLSLPQLVVDGPSLALLALQLVLALALVYFHQPSVPHSSPLTSFFFLPIVTVVIFVFSLVMCSFVVVVGKL